MSKRYKIIIVGDAGVGKSCLAANILDQPISHTYIRTEAPKMSSIDRIVNNQVVNIEIWDMPGDNQYITISSHYYNGAHGAILVYSITSDESLRNVKHWIENINNVLSDSLNLKKVVVGLKTDKIEKVESFVSMQAGESKAASIDCKHFQCTNRNKKEVKVMFDELLKQILGTDDSIQNEIQEESSCCKCC